MRIALISPYSTGPLRGNIITVDRISRFLRQIEVETLVLPVDVLSAPEMERQIRSFAPHVIHSFHAHYCGGRARYLAARLNLPVVLTITGSDLYDPVMRNHSDTVRAIRAAQAVVCFGDREAAELAEHFPSVADHIVVIPQGVERLPVAASDSFGVAEGAFVLLVPAALRPVKQIEFPLKELAPLMSRLPAVQLVIAGGIIDQDYAATIRTLVCDTPYAVWLGEIPRKQMGALYRRADVVLNCSRSESMPNTLLEAMALSRPVLANDIPGNRSIISHDNTGLLYHDTDSFCEGVVRLVEDAELRSTLGQHAGECMRDAFSPESEAAHYLHLYRSLVM